MPDTTRDGSAEAVSPEDVDDFDLAMESVWSGKATLIQLDGDEFTATCGDDSRTIRLSQSAHVGDWLDSLREIVEDTKTSCRETYADETRIILGASLNSGAIKRLLREVGKVTERLKDEALPPGRDQPEGELGWAAAMPTPLTKTVTKLRDAE